jgi:hypothetical protein
MFVSGLAAMSLSVLLATPLLIGASTLPVLPLIGVTVSP